MRHAQQKELTDACNELINSVEDGKSKALLVRTEHERDKSTWTLSMLDDDQGFIFRGSDQADFVPGLQPDRARRVPAIEAAAGGAGR